VDDSGAGVLAERQDALGSCLGVAEELQSYVLVVLRCLWVGENLSHLQVVLATEHELYIVERLLREQCERFLRNLKDCLTLELACAYALGGKQAILGSILAHLEHRSILEIWCCCHSVIWFKK
jgi:hypothetical protein